MAVAGKVKAIDRRSVHQICSGQVVLNLATAIKELVENSLDAGATIIEIKLKDYGGESLEVSDNASGVQECNFSGLTLKHHTSKLHDFSDLSTVDTFGFRGEALSSLCALSDLTIVTCHRSASVGTKLVYDHDGKILKQVPCPRQQGTTVTLQNLFSTLPVRHKEFQRNLKKEFTKMVQVLQAYCIIASGVKLTCTNQTDKGKKSLVVSTNGTSTMRENVANVFGSKQIQSLLEFDQCRPTPEMCEEYGIKPERLEKIPFSVSGFVSKCDHGQGRSAADRQYYFINRRPCDFPKVSKLINEVFHMYNRHQFPFVVMDISLAKDAVDVNVTPDKRKVLVQEEKTLLAILKASLKAMFEPRSSCYDVNQKPLSAVTPSSLALSNMFSRSPSSSQGSSQTSTGSPSTGQVSSPASSLGCSQFSSSQGSPCFRPSSQREGKRAGTLNLGNLKRSFAHASHQDDGEEERQPKQPKLDAFFQSSQELTNRSDSVDRIPSTFDERESSETFSDTVPSCTISFENCRTEPEGIANGKSPIISLQHSIPPSRVETEEVGISPLRNKLHDSLCTDEGSKTGESHKVEDCLSPGVALLRSDGESGFCESSTGGSSGIRSSEESQTNSSQEPSQETQEHRLHCTSTDVGSAIEDGETHRILIHRMDDSTPSSSDSGQRREVTVPLSLAGLRRAREQRETQEREEGIAGRTFRAKIAPSDNASAEEELSREISKDMFSKMEILGQFNLGFIIAKLGQDLFIIDQHATDEKYNFETLQKHTVLQGQRLIQPLPLELTAVNESILMDDVEIFKKNGFDFIIDEDGRPTERVKLVSQPFSKNWTFGKDDIDELIFMLSDAPGVHCRPTKVRQMFASRSCRKSIMIGTALNKAEMKKLVCHMGELEQPWNCPHGRPTMRHLFNLNMMPD
ncbi:mismatch repair endonuclease PMS2 [Strongylocentrotus purpuratus]|uniref:Mismatch repair endonuclease PMS2 n=1 Tax=Strongylocentrotus purpuratus TaxID=7668 RepID=A0A7M7REZ7_STRPU|nr:mismatch repair endonuclease PMS2 [Strongylocentrotus purpuratus]